MNKTTMFLILVLGLGVNNLWAHANKDNTNTEQSTKQTIKVETEGEITAASIGGHQSNKQTTEKVKEKQLKLTADVTVPSSPVSAVV